MRERWEASTFASVVPLPPRPTWKDLPKAVREPYALTDAVAHRTLRNVLWERIVDEKLERVYRLDMSVVPLLVRQEEIGMACDPRALRRLSRTFQRDHDEVCRQINDLAGFDVNPHSGEQVSDCLFDELGIRPTKPTPSGKHYTTGDKYLKARRNEHAIIPLILTARQLQKYRSTYTEKLPDMLAWDEATGTHRYHLNWKYTRTATGRLAEEIILLIPKHDPLAKAERRANRAQAIRNCFFAADGHRLVSVDLSQIELRSMAHLSRDRRLLDAYQNGEDIHANVAHELLGAPKGKDNQDESAHRLPAKTVNFGIINGMSEYGMLDQLHEAGQLHWDIEQTRELLAGWWRIHKGVKRYWEDRIAEAKARGYVEDLFGRRRYIWAILTTDDRVYAEAARQCLCPIQATADGISKRWNARIWKYVIGPRQAGGQYCEPWVRLHDDSIIECDEAQSKAVSREMLDLVPNLLDIPTTAEAKFGTQWGDLH